MLSEERIKNARRALNNFSLGVRGCGGEAMAWYQITLAIARVIYVYNFRRTPGDLGHVGAGQAGAKDGRQRPEEFQLAACFTSIVNGPMVEFRPRGEDDGRKWPR